MDLASQVVFAVAGALCPEGDALCFTVVMFAIQVKFETSYPPFFKKRRNETNSFERIENWVFFYDF